MLVNERPRERRLARENGRTLYLALHKTFPGINVATVPVKRNNVPFHCTRRHSYV